MLAKAATRGADGVILNLEDAVAPGSKVRARCAVAGVLTSSDFGCVERIVRINSLDSDLGFADLLAIAPLAPDAILLSKVNSTEQVRIAAWMIERIESSNAVPVGTIQIMCMIETAAGIQSAPEIALAHPRVTALVFGTADLCAEVGCSPGAVQGPLAYSSSRLILSARIAHVAAIDAPHMQLGDEEGLRRSVRESRDLGFDGKSAIHPAQIPVIHTAFSPTAEEVRWAESVMEALAATNGEQVIRGAALLDGSLIEAPHLLRARKTLESAQHARIEEE
jgi:citrate lyase beta subunit